ncbi:tyrosine-protein phosphatase [Alteribacter natronophilus]|uniref:tyrosine-protein phosphatase n=1 Tax=Alteribacter natronophilus TaxID=2583810 RepID=UPI00110DA413|nr:CpsB/CapC family capsule biosynthesis tyrosine phosphatase [Alteribacter natronophilus]TMW72239.1 tyrosine protein phosphatase [Alteribacter natronophilus]
MIDLHSHILPGVDDGAATMEDALAMARAASQEGIRTIVATPHHQNGKYTNERTEIIDAVRELNVVLKDNHIELDVLPGQENRIYGELIEDFRNGEILPLNESKYLFVELPSNRIPRFTNQLFYDIQVEGLQPIIVHPERNQEIMKHPERLYELVKNGALTQVTATSVAGRFGKKIQKLSEDLIEANLTHIVASDAHSMEGRGFAMREAYDRIEQEFGNQMVYLFQENAELIIENSQVMIEPPQKVKQKKFLGLF